MDESEFIFEIEMFELDFSFVVDDDDDDEGEDEGEDDDDDDDDNVVGWVFYCIFVEDVVVLVWFRLS